MTTIAYKKIGKGGVIACDCQGSDDGRKTRAKIKAQVFNQKVYIVMGSLAIGLRMVQWILNPDGKDCPLDDTDVETAVVEMSLKTGKAQVWEGSVPMPVEDKLYVKGSGGTIALGAMEAGASPAKAVAIAAKWDEGTGMGVQEFTSSRK